MIRKQLLLLLALLITAATGAWAQTGMTKGSFSVSATKRVHFSKGNLQLVGENTFQFAENQWDVFGSSQSNGHRDLFGWGSANNPDLTSEDNNDYSTFTDWGTKIGDGTTWRTLTNDEWNYVLNTRTASTLSETENARYAYATVNGVSGLILFPDNYTHPGTVAAPTQINTSSAAFSANTYDVQAWLAMESAGAVFLPHGGWRKGNTHNSDQANYWSSTPSSTAENQASGLRLSGMVFASWWRYRGCNVRLVTDEYVLTLADGTQDAKNWTIASGDNSVKGDVADGLKGLSKGDAVTLTYGGRLKVKNVTATTDAAPAGPKAAKDATAEDLGKVIGADGNIYDDVDAATAANTTALAKIFYVGSDNGEDAPYNHGLALALGDVSDTKTWCSQEEATCLGTGHQFDSKAGAKGDMAGIDNTDALVNNTGHIHDAASAARNYNSGTHPAGTSAWFLPSAGQWDKMATAAGSYANLINNAGLQGGDAAYWSSTEGGANYAWLFDSSKGDLSTYGKDYDFQVRACLAF